MFSKAEAVRVWNELKKREKSMVADASFAEIAPGRRVEIMVGGRGDVQAVGLVRQVTGARFCVQFPAVPEASIGAPFRMTFRKVDGRSVGGTLFKFAKVHEA